jgi:hypothetical protein
VRWLVLTGPNAGVRSITALQPIALAYTGTPHWYIVEFPEPWNSYEGLRALLEASWLEGCWLCSIRIVKPVNVIVPLSQVEDAVRGILGRIQKPRRVQVRVRGHGSGRGDGLYKRLRSLVSELGLRSTGHSGSRLIIDVGIWPRWLTGNEFTVTISLYTNNGVIVNWVRERRRHKPKPKPKAKPEAKPKPEPKPVETNQQSRVAVS